MEFKKGDKAVVIAPPDGFVHYYKVDEIITVTLVAGIAIYCVGDDGLEQCMRSNHLKRV